MKKLPSKVVILGRTVRIKQGNNLHFLGEPCLGLCDYDAKTIYLEKNQSPEMKHDTLVHEMGHFFLELSGISQKLSDSENEIYCQLITAFHNDINKSLK
jgi:Zn-dependent peptidase ImmA (M78 family)